MKTETLKPCPFCGMEAEGEYPPQPAKLSVPWAADMWTVQCENCGASAGYETNKESAAELWNTREVKK